MYYLGYIHGGKATKAESAGITRGDRVLREFYVERELQQMGIECYLPKTMTFKRTGKKRRPEPCVTPTLPNYIFIDTPAERFTELLGIKYLHNTLVALTRTDIASLEEFRAWNDAEYAKAEKAAQNQDAICEYTDGQMLVMLGGPFADRVMRFRGMIERAGDLFPRVQVEFEMMNQTITAELDPLDVKAAE